MPFSPYSLLPGDVKQAMINEERAKPLKSEYIPNLKRDLKRGWLLPILYNYDSVMDGRWEYWMQLQVVPKEKLHFLEEKDPEQRLKNINEHILPDEPIPELDFDTTYATTQDKGRKMLEICLDKMLTRGGYVDIMTRVEYFLDWLLYALGHPNPWFKELPPEPHSCDGCSIVLYQLFNLFPLLDCPKDYWGNLIADAKGKGSQKHTGYFPTPNTVANAISKMVFCKSNRGRLETMCEPAIGTGVMTLDPSNYIFNAVGVDIDKILLKACLFNWYMYCPWFAMPIWYLADKTDLLWGNSLAGPDHPDYPRSIHQKYWLEQYRNIYPVTLVEKDWQEEMQKIIDLMPAPVEAPKIKVDKEEEDTIKSVKPVKPKSFKRKQGKKKSKSLF